jgi:hypothetical protein
MQIHLMWAVVDSEGRITIKFSDDDYFSPGASIFDTRQEAREHAGLHGGAVIKIQIRPWDVTKELYNYDSR